MRAFVCVCMCVHARVKGVGCLRRRTKKMRNIGRSTEMQKVDQTDQAINREEKRGARIDVRQKTRRSE